jgi:hypothetical protein
MRIQISYFQIFWHKINNLNTYQQKKLKIWNYVILFHFFHFVKYSTKTFFHLINLTSSENWNLLRLTWFIESFNLLSSILFCRTKIIKTKILHELINHQSSITTNQKRICWISNMLFTIWTKVEFLVLLKNAFVSSLNNQLIFYWFFVNNRMKFII